MKKYIFLLSMVFAGCASVGQKQTECESHFTEFADVVECTKQATASDPRAKNHAGYKLYMLRGEQLAQQVKDKQISNLDARVEWQRLYLEIKNDDEARTSRAVQNYNQSRPKTTTCVPVGNSVSCTSN